MTTPVRPFTTRALRALRLTTALWLGGLSIGPALGETELAAAANGDVNGDQTIDISDASHLLGWLFLGGREPVPCEGAGGAPSPLPATGQTSCYGLVEGEGWREVPCDRAGCPGQDASYVAGCPQEGRFIDHQDGTVTDTCTGLVWQQSPGDLDGDGELTDTDRLSWCESLGHADSLSLAGHDDWRLPSVRELTSLFDDGGWRPAVAPVFELPRASRDWAFWTSTSWAEKPGRAYQVTMGASGTRTNPGPLKGIPGFPHWLLIWAVRTAAPPDGNGDVNGDQGIDISDATYLLGWLFLGGPRPVPCGTGAAAGLPDTGQAFCHDHTGELVPCDASHCPGQDGYHATGCAAADRFANRGDGTVADACTGLVWLQAAADVSHDGQVTEDDVLDWCAALEYCERLSFAGHTDWRLPNLQELASLVDYARSEPALDPAFAMPSGTDDSSVPFVPFFSSTTSAARAETAWGVRLGLSGEIFDVDKSQASFVIAVRDGP
jgi:hypothetical protein